MSQSGVNVQITSTKEALKRLGCLAILAAGLFQFFVGIQFIGLIDDVYLLSYVLLFVSGLILSVLGILEFAYDWINFKLQPMAFTLVSMAILIVSFFFAPESSSILSTLTWGNSIGMVGVFFMIIVLRPNFGPTANKKIYQAVAGILAFFIACGFLILGVWVLTVMNIANFAGRGTFPGDFYYTFIETIPLGAGVTTYNAIKNSGTLMIVTSVFILFTVFIRNKISLKIASILLFAGIIWGITDVIIFGDQWAVLGRLFYTHYKPIYSTTLILSDPGVITGGTILILLWSIALLMMVYASFAAKPIQAWRRKRDSDIAAAEVFFRESKLPSAIKYLEKAAQLSSKIDEEDKSVELLTRIKQIKDKAIKMKKAEAAEKAKKDYDKQKKVEEGKGGKEEGKAPKKEKVSAVDEETGKQIEGKMRKAMDKDEEEK
jgi:hypothetical protein